MSFNLDGQPPPAPGPGCPMDCTVSTLGSRAAMLVLRQAFYGDRRFEAFVQHTGISEATIAKRLHELVGAGVLKRRPYQEPGARVRHEYELTPAGEELLPVIIGLFEWGRRHLAESQADLELVGPDGRRVDVAIQSSTGERLNARQIQIRPSEEPTVL